MPSDSPNPSNLVPNLSKLSVSAKSVEFSRKTVRDAVRRREVLFDLQSVRGSLEISAREFKQTCFQSTTSYRLKKGAYNHAVTVPASSDLDAPFTKYYGMNDKDMLTYIGRIRRNGYTFRWSRVDLPEEKIATFDSLCEELYLTLYAAQSHIGPPVYGATILNGGPPPEKPMLYMLLGSGIGGSSLFDFEEEDVDHFIDWQRRIALHYVRACSRAGDHGLLLNDIKPSNSIYVYGDADDSIDIIDFDDEFTFQFFKRQQEYEYDHECLTFMNLLLLATNIRCNYSHANALLDRLVTELILLRDSITNNRFCELFEYWFQNMDVAVEFVNKSMIQPALGIVRVEDYDVVMVKTIYTMYHYVFQYHNGPCAFKLRTGPNALPVLEQLYKWLRAPSARLPNLVSLETMHSSTT